MHHLPHATHSPQYLGALQAHTPPGAGAAIALTFIGLVIVLCFRAGLRRNSRD